MAKRPGTKDQFIGLYVTQEMVDEIDKYAIENDLSKSQVIRMAITKLFNQLKGGN